jgi:hypothetical protein
MHTRFSVSGEIVSQGDQEGVMKARFAVAALALAAALGVSATAANAATVVFDFGVGPNGVTTSSWQNGQGQSHNYTASGLTITAGAFGPSLFGVADQLYGKHGGGDENGLGMTNDPSHEDEIYYGQGFIQLDVSSLTHDLLTLAFGSTTQGETWTVYGTDIAGAVGSPTLPGVLNTSLFKIGSGNADGTLSFTDSYKYYDIVSTVASGGKNVLLTSLTVTPVPEPAAWGLMIAGVFCIGAAMRRQRQGAFAAV